MGQIDPLAEDEAARDRLPMSDKVLIPLFGDDVAPRFDLATEVLIAVLDSQGDVREDRIIVVSQASAEQLCHMVLKEEIGTVICGGIEEEYHQYLQWKRVSLLDGVIGAWKAALSAYVAGRLEPGSILCPRRKSHEC